jgi:hypothetical protein
MRTAIGAGTAALALVLPGPASAHAFSTGKDAYGNFLEGAGVILVTPVLLLPLLALAVALGLWRAEGLLAAWPHALAGSLIGVLAAPFAGPWVGLAAMGIGLVVAVFAALVPLARSGNALPWLAALTGVAVLAASLEGHSYAEISNATRAGLMFGAHFALAAAAGLVRLTRDHVRHPATTILWRVVASWIAAIVVLYLAFSLRG